MLLHRVDQPLIDLREDFAADSDLTDEELLNHRHHPLFIDFANSAEPDGLQA